MEARRGVSMYMPPHDLPEFKHVFDQNISFPRHKWAAALGAYSYRLKPSLYKQLEQRRLELWPESVGGTGRSSALRCNSNCDAKDERGAEERVVWGLHVRHGDVLSLKDVYGNRRPFEFKEYFNIALDRARQYGAVPDAVYVTSDNPDTTDFVEAQCMEAALKRWSKVAPGSPPPCIFTVDATQRYRTEHGSHTIAAGSGAINIYTQHFLIHLTRLMLYQRAAARSASAPCTSIKSSRLKSSTPTATPPRPPG